MRRQRKRFVNPYQAYRGKSRAGKTLLVLAGSILAILAVLLIAAGLIFRRELSIASTVKQINFTRPAYFMEVTGDYHFQEFLEKGGASSDGEVSAFLSKKIAKGLAGVPVEAHGTGCSALSAKSTDGEHFWGRNYDWTGSVPIILRHVPKEGYASLSTCDFQNITGNPEVLPEGMANRMLAIAALYVPLDGVNAAGLCVADLQVNEGGMPDPDTEKPDLTVTTAIRLLLDKAATVEEAVALLRQYDIHPSGGVSHHLAISDASGATVSVEFTEGGEGGVTVIPAVAVTNFNLANGDTAAGGESAQTRYKRLQEIYLEKNGVLTRDELLDALSEVSQTEGTWTTQWSMAYNQASPHVTWYFDGDFSRGTGFSILPEPK